MRMRAGAGLVVLVAVVAAACSDDDTAVVAGPEPEASATTTAGPVRYEADATVLEAPDHGPQLCHLVMTSLPPQCDGPVVVGWSWDGVEGEETANGTTWGRYRVVGTWDGATFTLTEPATSPALEPESAPPDFSSPCPEPSGGWTPVDPETTTFDAQQAVAALAASLPGFAGMWVDQSPNPMFENGSFGANETAANDPLHLVVNIRTTGDIPATEAQIREVWGGALCVSPAERTMVELVAIANEIAAPNLLSVNADVLTNRVEVLLMAPDPATQAEFDQRYGEGTVVVDSWLQPVG